MWHGKHAQDVHKERDGEGYWCRWMFWVMDSLGNTLGLAFLFLLPKLERKSGGFLPAGTYHFTLVTRDHVSASTKARRREEFVQFFIAQ